jgi:hypothetical protein
VVSDDIEPVLLELSVAREETDTVGNEEDVTVCDCKEVLVSVVSDEIELLLLELSVA